MSLKTKPSFIIRKLELNDCEEVLDILAEVEFVVEKYRNEILMNIDSDAILVAQDIETGNIDKTLRVINFIQKIIKRVCFVYIRKVIRALLWI